MTPKNPSKIHKNPRTNTATKTSKASSCHPATQGWLLEVSGWSPVVATNFCLESWEIEERRRAWFRPVDGAACKLPKMAGKRSHCKSILRSYFSPCSFNDSWVQVSISSMYLSSYIPDFIDGFSSTMFFWLHKMNHRPQPLQGHHPQTLDNLWIHLPWCWWWCLVYVHQTFQWASVGTTAWLFHQGSPYPGVILYPSGGNPIWNLAGWNTFETTSQLTSFLQVRNRMQ